MKLKGAQLHHVPGWTGPLSEDSEPDKKERLGGLDEGMNFVVRPNGLRDIRGGSAVVQTLAAVAGNAITDVLGGWPYAPAGMVVIAHSLAAAKHYAYALGTDAAFVTGAEATSRVDLGWSSATPGRPQAVELFEKLYVVDGREATSRYGMAVLTYTGGVWSVANPTYDLDASGGSPGAIKGYCCEVFGSVLFVAGHDSETAADAPHMVRHSFLGVDPAASNGFDVNAYAIIGAKGQRVRAMKAGRTMMLVAKANELYAISGSGSANPGWQYQIQPVGNTVGAGVTNSLALEHALGMWYGVGDSGPWRSDGATVELLLSERDRSWRRLDNLDRVAVRYNPERRQVLFAFNRAGLDAGMYTADIPNEFWKWDVDSEQWDLSDRYRRAFHQVNAVTISPTPPAAPPSAITQSFGFGDFQHLAGLSQAWATFTTGDIFANTEVWARSESGSSALQDTLPTGVRRFAVDPYYLNGAYGKIAYVKLRHTKGGVPSDFSPEVALYPMLPPPRVELIFKAASPTPRYPNLTAFADGADLLGTSTDTWSKTWAAASIATYEDTHNWTTPFNAVIYRGQLERTSWPVSHTLSVVQEHQSNVGLGGAASALSEPRQDYFSGLRATSIVVTWEVPYYYGYSGSANARNVVLEYRVTGSGSGWTTAATVTPGALPMLSQLTTVTGLSACTKYDFRTREVTASAVSGTAVCYTALTAPTIVATTAGTPGSPHSDISITMPVSGKDCRVYNADLSYNQLFAAHAVGPTVHVSTVGIGGAGDRYYACTVDSSWPTGFTHSTPAFDDVDDPCTTGS